MMKAVHNVLSIGNGRSTARGIKGAKIVKVTLVDCGVIH